jgi:hypothetical protein
VAAATDAATLFRALAGRCRDGGSGPGVARKFTLTDAGTDIHVTVTDANLTFGNGVLELTASPQTSPLNRRGRFISVGNAKFDVPGASFEDA